MTAENSKENKNIFAENERELLETADLSAFYAEIDSIIKLVNRTRTTLSGDFQAIQAQRLNKVRASTPFFCDYFAERLKLFVADSRKGKKNESEAILKLSKKCLQLELITSEEHTVINNNVVSTNIMIQKNEEVLKGIPNDENNFGIIGPETDANSLVNSFNVRQQIKSKFPHDAEDLDQILLEKFENKPLNLEANERNEYELEYEAKTELNDLKKSRKRQIAESKQKNPLDAIAEMNDESSCGQNQALLSISDLSMAPSSYSGQKLFLDEEEKVAHDMMIIDTWNNYKTVKVQIPEVASKTKIDVSDAMVELLNQYSEISTIEHYEEIKFIEEQLLKICLEEKIFTQVTIAHYGQRTGPSNLRNANYNISLDGKLASYNLAQSMGILYECFQKLIENQLGFQCIFYPCSRFGIPKLLIRQKNLIMIVSINDEVGKTSSGLVSAYRNSSPLVNQLILLIKLWSSLQGISNDEEGFLSSFSWENLVIGFLQRYDSKIFPSLQKASNISRIRDITLVDGIDRVKEVKCNLHFESPRSPEELMASTTLYSLVGKFFRFYLEKFKPEYMISIRCGKVLKNPEGNDYLFSIEDPFFPKFNLGSSCRRHSLQADTILNKMKQALSKLQRTDLNWIQS